MSKKYIVLVGQLGSGKGTAAEYLRKKGFKIFKFSDVLKKQVKGTPSREALQDLGDELRRQKGNQILADLMLKKAAKSGYKKVVFDGARSPQEVKYLKERGAFVIGITAAKRLRFERLKKRGQERDPKTWRQFLEADSRDLGTAQPRYGQQVGKSLRLADVVIENKTSPRSFQKALTRLFNTHIPWAERERK